MSHFSWNWQRGDVEYWFSVVLFIVIFYVVLAFISAKFTKYWKNKCKKECEANGKTFQDSYYDADQQFHVYRCGV